MKKSDLQKPYTLRDFEKETDTISRLKMCLIQQEFVTYLNDKEMRYFNELYQTFATVYDAQHLLVPAEQIVKNVIDVSPKRAAKLVDDMNEVFHFGGDKKLKQQMIANFHWELAKKARDIAESPQDLDYASRIAERAAKLEGLDKLKEAPMDPNTIQLPDFIEISDDPEILIQQQKTLDMAHDNNEGE